MTPVNFEANLKISDPLCGSLEHVQKLEKDIIKYLRPDFRFGVWGLETSVSICYEYLDEAAESIGDHHSYINITFKKEVKRPDTLVAFTKMLEGYSVMIGMMLKAQSQVSFQYQ